MNKLNNIFITVLLILVLPATPLAQSVTDWKLSGLSQKFASFIN
jgi:hypothetical protein